MSIRSIRWRQPHDSSAIAKELVAFVEGAKHSLHIAIYDFRLGDSEKSLVVDAVKKAAASGIDVKIAYDHTKASGTTDTNKTLTGNDPAPRGTKAFIDENFPKGSKVHTQAIAGSHLMHNKYVIRDGSTKLAAVWMGSANFTHDAWSIQENNVLVIDSHELAQHYETDFWDLFKTGNIKGTGKNDYGQLKVDNTTVEFGFAPGEGSAIASLFVDAVQSAGPNGTVHIATMVLSSGPILGALVDHLQNGGKISGIYDATQMKGVETDWKKLNPPSPKIALWEQIKPLLIGKHSRPFSETTPHDFMHNKLLVTDKVVMTGSFNLSRNAESNAENALAIHDPKFAHEYIKYIDELVRHYRNKQ